MVSQSDCYHSHGQSMRLLLIQLQPIGLLSIRWSVNHIVANSISANENFANSMASQLDSCQFYGQLMRLLPNKCQPIILLPIRWSAHQVVPVRCNIIRSLSIRWSANQIVANSMVNLSDCLQFDISQSECCQFDGHLIRLLRVRWSVNQIVANSMVSQSDCC